jgi:hypothetical protein
MAACPSGVQNQFLDTGRSSCLGILAHPRIHADLRRNGILPKASRGVILTFWVLDADDQAEVERVKRILDEAGIAPSMVKTPRGAHFYFVLPPSFPLKDLKAHWCHKAKDENGDELALDFKFGPNSLALPPVSRWDR